MAELRSAAAGTAARGDYHTHQVHTQVFDADECQRIVELGRSLPTEGAGLEGEEGARQDEALRAAEIAWMPDAARTRWIFERLGELCAEANQGYGFELTSFDEDLQFTTYRTPGAFYTWHQDGLDGPVARRKLSIVVQLSDPLDYRGADLELFQAVEDLDADELDELRRSMREQGTAVVFPAFEYHRVTPLLGGCRHSLVSWVSGPPFR